MNRFLPTILILPLIFLGCSYLLPSVELYPEEGIDINRLYSPEELKEDLDYLFETMEDVHPNLYAFTPKDTLDVYRIEIISVLSDSISSLEFWKLIRPIVTKIGDGHTVLHFPKKFFKANLDRGGTLFPAEVKIIDGRIFVKSNYTADSIFSVNSEVLAINNIPANKIIKDMDQYESGERIEHKYIRMEWRFNELLWALYNFNNQFSVDFVSAINNRQYSKTYPGITADSLNAIKNRTTVKTNDRLNTYQSLKEEKIGIIDLRSFLEFSTFDKFLKTTFIKIQDDEIEHLIIDIQNNRGGNSMLADALFQYITDEPYKHVEKVAVKTSKKSKELFKKLWFRWYLYPLLPLAYLHPEGRTVLLKPDGTITEYEGTIRKIKKNPLRFHGDVYLLTGPQTYSSGNIFASIFKCAEMGTVIGEETGGLTVAYGDALIFILPNTQLAGWVSRKKFVEPCGKEGHGVIPDYIVEQTPEDREKGVDTVMEFTKELIRNKSL